MKIEFVYLFSLSIHIIFNYFDRFSDSEHQNRATGAAHPELERPRDARVCQHDGQAFLNLLILNHFKLNFNFKFIFIFNKYFY
jgi:hypothetical protein